MNDVDTDPPINALCDRCFGVIMELGEGERDPMVNAAGN